MEAAASAPKRAQWNHAAARAFGLNLLLSIPPGDTLLVSGDNQLFSLVYLQVVEGWGRGTPWFEESAKLSPPLATPVLETLVASRRLSVAMWSGWEHRVFGNPSPQTLRTGPFAHGLIYRLDPPSFQEGIQLWKRMDIRELEGFRGEFNHELVALQYRYLRGVWEVQAGLDSGRAVLARAGWRGGENARFQYNLGAFYATMGWRREAEYAYRQAIYWHPDYPLPYTNLGVLLLERGESEEAMRLFRRVIQLQPSRADGYVNLGAALAQSGRLEEAVQVWRAGLAMAPGHPALLHNLERASAERTP